MRVIVIGAGRGRRLMPTTADAPKCFAEVAGKRLLDWALDAFARTASTASASSAATRSTRCKADYPQFTFRHNADWENNNILASLFYAADLMDEPFICCYSDMLFTPDIVAPARQLAGRHGAGRRHRAGSSATSIAPTIRPTMPRR